MGATRSFHVIGVAGCFSPPSTFARRDDEDDAFEEEEEEEDDAVRRAKGSPAAPSLRPASWFFAVSLLLFGRRLRIAVLRDVWMWRSAWAVSTRSSALRTSDDDWE